MRSSGRLRQEKFECSYDHHILEPALDGALPLPAAGAAAKRARRAADASARTAKALEQLSVASSSHGKVCRALRLTHSRVLSAVESARHIPSDSLRAGAGTS